MIAFNGHNMAMLRDGEGTPNGNNYSLTLIVFATNMGEGKTFFGWGFAGGYDRANGCISRQEESVSGIFRENFDTGVEWGNMLFLLESNGFQPTHVEGQYRREDHPGYEVVCHYGNSMYASLAGMGTIVEGPFATLAEAESHKKAEEGRNVGILCTVRKA